MNDIFNVNEYPYTNLHELNLDFILDEMQNLDENKQDKLVSTENIKSINGQSILGSGNLDVTVSSGVQSVNGKTGVVVLDAEDVGALPDDTEIPEKTSDLENDSGFITDSALTPYRTSANQDIIDAGKQATLVSGTNIKTINNQSVLGSGNIVISGSGAVDSVNGKTGVVVLDAEDVGALPDTTSIPSKTSDLTNDSGFITNSALTPYRTSSDQDDIDAALEALIDTKIDNPAAKSNGQVLTYNSTSGAWEAQNSQGGSPVWGNITGTLADQTDLNTRLTTDETAISNKMDKWDLLWTNASPSSDFAAQTISLDLSNYDRVYTVVISSGVDKNFGVFLEKDGNRCSICGVGTGSTSLEEGVTALMCARQATVTNTGIVFLVGLFAYNTSIFALGNAYAKPYKIYGIKGANENV